MFKFRISILLVVFLFSPCIYLYADIVITNDEMILNGKILEEKKESYVKLGNYHGTFIIEYKLIKEIHRTERYEDDFKFFLKKKKPVNESDVKTNYQAGLEQLEKQKKANKDKIPADGRHAILVSPFFNINLGKLNTVLPYSYGVNIMGDIAINRFQYLKKMFLTGIRTEIGYFHSEKGVKRVIGLSALAGPLWQFPISIGTYRFNYSIAPEFGVGWYSIKGRTEKLTAVKWNADIITGPIFKISSAVISPLIKFNYIYDNIVPLYGISFSIGAGFSL